MDRIRNPAGMRPSEGPGDSKASDGSREACGVRMNQHRILKLHMRKSVGFLGLPD